MINKIKLDTQTKVLYNEFNREELKTMRIYNTLSKTIEDFKPIDENLVKMYTCGPTVYNFAHLGNLRMYIHEDVFEKTLRYLGYNVKRVMNITDVGHLESDADDGEDKMLKGAKEKTKLCGKLHNIIRMHFLKILKS